MNTNNLADAPPDERLFFTPEELRALLHNTVLPKLEAVKIFYDQRKKEFADESGPELVRLFAEFLKEVGDASGLALYGLGSQELNGPKLQGSYEPGKNYEIIDAILDKLQAVQDYCAEQPPDRFDDKARRHCLQLYLDFLQQCANTLAGITFLCGVDPTLLVNAFGGTGKYLSQPVV